MSFWFGRWEEENLNYIDIARTSAWEWTGSYPRMILINKDGETTSDPNYDMVFNYWEARITGIRILGNLEDDGR